MCGIFGYIGTKKDDDAATRVVAGLGRLSYRGYDSWGVAGVDSSGITVTKDVGVVPAQKPKTVGLFSVAVGHTRWATHGGVTKNNAHPHLASDGSFALAQNGIVENFLELRERLKKEFSFTTQTDTEVIVRLIEKKKQKTTDLHEAVRAAFMELEGRNTVIILAEDSTVIAARNGSPLVLGKSKSGNSYFSSDTLSFANEVETVLVVENGQMVVCEGQTVQLFDIASGDTVVPKFEALTVVAETADKAG